MARPRENPDQAATGAERMARRRERAKAQGLRQVELLLPADLVTRLDQAASDRGTTRAAVLADLLENLPR